MYILPRPHLILVLVKISLLEQRLTYILPKPHMISNLLRIPLLGDLDKISLLSHRLTYITKATPNTDLVKILIVWARD